MYIYIVILVNNILYTYIIIQYIHVIKLTNAIIEEYLPVTPVTSEQIPSTPHHKRDFLAMIRGVFIVGSVLLISTSMFSLSSTI